MSDIGDRVRHRLREEMARLKRGQQDIADLVQWTQSRVAQKLTGRTPITLEELDALAFAVDLPVTELVRDHGLEFCAEMTPTELRVLERFRQLAPDQQHALMTILDVKATTKRQDRRAALPKKANPAKALHGGA